MPFNVWLCLGIHCRLKMCLLIQLCIWMIFNTNLYALMWAIIWNMPIHNMYCTIIITYLLTRWTRVTCGSSHSNIQYIYIYIYSICIYIAVLFGTLWEEWQSWSYYVNLGSFSNKLKKETNKSAFECLNAQTVLWALILRITM